MGLGFLLALYGTPHVPKQKEELETQRERERGGKNGRYPGGSGMRVAKILFLGGQELNLYLIRR